MCLIKEFGNGKGRALSNTRICNDAGDHISNFSQHPNNICYTSALALDHNLCIILASMDQRCMQGTGDVLVNLLIRQSCYLMPTRPNG